MDTDIVKLVAQKRHQAGKGVSRRLRRAGQLPAVIYGNGETVALALQEKDVALLHQSSANENTILELVIEGESTENCRAIMRQVQLHPSSRALLHADLYRVDMAKPITVTVALDFLNEPLDRLRGINANATVMYVTREVQVTCLPHAIPDTIAVDLTDLELGTPYKAVSLVLPAGVTLETDVEEVLATAHVVMPEAEAETEAEAAEQ